MSEAILPLLVDRAGDGGYVLKSPKVGIWSDVPAEGSILVPGSAAGRLDQLGRRHDLVVPDGAAGRVARVSGRDRRIAVAYGETLFHLTRVAGAIETGAPEAGAPPSGGGGLTLRAPTDGVYYLAPSPGAKPYVAPGDRLVAGQVVGLIEVMKTFNPILFEGPGLPDEAVVKAVLAADGEEVRAGRPLLELG